MFHLRPELDDPQLLRLFHLAARAQWTSQDYASVPLVEQLSPREGLALARMITPVYLGEQTAMLGAATALTRFAGMGKGSYMVYLASFMMDEARHFEALTRLYERVGQHPLSVREMPDMLRYHHRMRLSKEIHTWVFGIMVSDVFAKHFYQSLNRTFGQYPLGHMSRRVIQDESRHQAFAEHYLSREIPRLPEDQWRELWSLKEDLLAIVSRMAVQLGDDARALGIDPKEFFDRFATEVEERAARVGLPACLRRCPYRRQEAGEPVSEEDWKDLSAEACSSCWVTRLAQAAGADPGTAAPVPGTRLQP